MRTKDILAALAAADQFLLTKLKQSLERILLKNLENSTCLELLSFAGIFSNITFHFSYLYLVDSTNCERLYKACLGVIAANWATISADPNSKNLKPETIALIESKRKQNEWLPKEKRNE